MNIQIFGKNKCFDTKKAERYFKERRIKYQRVDIEKYGSAGANTIRSKGPRAALKTLSTKKAPFMKSSLYHISPATLSARKSFWKTPAFSKRR